MTQNSGPMRTTAPPHRSPREPRGARGVVATAHGLLMGMALIALVMLSCWLPASSALPPDARALDGISTASAQPGAAVASLARDLNEHLDGAAAPHHAPLPLHPPVEGGEVLLQLDDAQGSEGLQQPPAPQAHGATDGRRRLPPAADFTSAHPLRADRPPTA